MKHWSAVEPPVAIILTTQLEVDVVLILQYWTIGMHSLCFKRYNAGPKISPTASLRILLLLP